MRVCVFIVLSALLASRLLAREISLEQAYDYALESDQSVRIAWFESRKADLAPASALTRLGPSLTGSTRLDTLSRGGSSSGRTDSGQSSITLSQPLFDATVFPAYERGKLQSQSTRLDYQSILREVLYGVTAAYYAVLQQERIVAVDKQTVDLAKENLDISEKRSNAGEVTRTDVLRATAALEGNRRTLIESESTLDLNRNRLANILNLDQSKGIEVVEPKETKESLPSFESLLGRAYQKREDLRVQELAIAQDEQRRREVKAGYIPKVSANVSALSGSSSGNGGKNDSSSWEATLSLQVPFFTGGQREIDLKTAQYQINQTRLNYEKFKKTVQEDVRTAWVNVRTLTETIKALQAQVVAADQGYKDLQNQYKAGTATSLDVLDSLKSLNFARKDLAVQTFAYQVALRRVEQVTGVFQEQRIKKVAP